MANYMKKRKELDESVVTDTELMDPSLKNKPIYLPDGVPVKNGMTIFTVRRKGIGTSSDSEVKHYSGDVGSEIILNTVVAVNQGANARNFTVRSDRGCETTYSVKNNCLPDLFGKRASAIAKAKKFNDKDIATVEAKLVNVMKTVTKYNTTIKALKKAKFQ